MLRRVGELDEEDLLGRDLADADRISAAREDVKAVQADTERGVICGRDDRPGMVVLADVAPPGERLVGHPNTALRRLFGEFAQLLGRQRVVVDRAAQRRSSTAASGSLPSSSMIVELEIRHGAGSAARLASDTASRSRNG